MIKPSYYTCALILFCRLRLAFNWLIYAFAGYLDTEQVRNVFLHTIADSFLLFQVFNL